MRGEAGAEDVGGQRQAGGLCLELANLRTLEFLYIAGFWAKAIAEDKVLCSSP